MIFRQHSAADFAGMIIDQFDEMLRLSVRYPLVCSIVLHPFIIGQPFRLRAFRRALRPSTHPSRADLVRPVGGRCASRDQPADRHRPPRSNDATSADRRSILHHSIKPGMQTMPFAVTNDGVKLHYEEDRQRHAAHLRA